MFSTIRKLPNATNSESELTMSRGQSTVASVFLIVFVTITLAFDKPRFSGFVYLFFAILLGFVAVTAKRLGTTSLGSVAISKMMHDVSSDPTRQRGLMVVAWILWGLGFLNSGSVTLLPPLMAYVVVLLTVLIHWSCLTLLLLATRRTPQESPGASSSELRVTEVFAAFSAAGVLILLLLSFFLLQHLRSGGESLPQIQPPQLGLLFVAFLSGMLALGIHLTERSRAATIHSPNRTWAMWAVLIIIMTGLVEYFGVRDWYRYALSSFCLGMVFSSFGRLLQPAAKEDDACVVRDGT